MTVIVQQPIDNNGNPQPMAYDSDTGKVIVDHDGYILNGANRVLAGIPSLLGFIDTPKTQTAGIQEAINYGQICNFIGANDTSLTGKQIHIILKDLGVYVCNAQITIPAGSSILIEGQGFFQPYFGDNMGNYSNINDVPGTTIYFTNNVPFPRFHIPQSSNGTASVVSLKNFNIIGENPSSYTSGQYLVDASGLQGGIWEKIVITTFCSDYNSNIDAGLNLINSTNGGIQITQFNYVYVFNFYNYSIIAELSNFLSTHLSVGFNNGSGSSTGIWLRSVGNWATFIDTHFMNLDVGMLLPQVSDVSQSLFTRNAPFFITPAFENINTPFNYGTALNQLIKLLNPTFIKQFTNSSASNYSGDVTNPQYFSIDSPQFLYAVIDTQNIFNRTTTNGTTAGTVTYSLVKWDVNYKKIMYIFNGYENDTSTNQTITLTTSLISITSLNITTNTTGLTITVDSTTGELTITAPDSTTTYSGIVIVEGY